MFVGYFTLMCGDGTNDVGALKHADVGVSILSNSCFKKKSEIKAELQAQTPALAPARPVDTPAMTPRERALAKHRANMISTQEMLQKTLKEIDDESVQIVKLGDASIAAPFTSKKSSIQSGKNL